MSHFNLTIKKVLLKYKSLDANIIHERNKLINDECLHNEICNILANQWQQQSLAQPIVCATLGGNNKLCSMIDEKTELMGQSPYWTWTKAQLKVNQQRDTIDLLLCDLVKAVMENEDAQIVIEREKIQTQTQTQNVNINSFLSAALGALVVNMFYYYFKY
jgi:hypothetical protein